MTFEWPPDYPAIRRRRLDYLQYLNENIEARYIAQRFYKNHPVEWINDWCMTFDPRRTGTAIDPRLMPFKLFPRQVDLVNFLWGCLKDKENGLIEKVRDAGASWVCSAFSAWLWIYHPGSVIGWGSRKEEYVDDSSDPKAIFPKIRQIMEWLPTWMLPLGFVRRLDMAYMKIYNRENGSAITGEAGDNIGRGGRTTIYFKDEALTLSSRVLTIKGWKPMGELTMADKVMGLNGKMQSIAHINDCGAFEVYSVGFSDGTKVECSPNHLWTLNTVRGKKKSVTIRTNELEKIYKYQSPRGQTQYKFRLPLIEPVVFKKKALPLHPYVVGALLGDGGLSQVPDHSPRLTSADVELVDYFTSRLPDYCTVKPSGKYSYRLGDVRGRMGWKHKSRIRQVMVDIGIAGKRSWEKSIPNDYKFSAISDRIELLQGLMDTDGSAGKPSGSASYYTSSKQLADDVRFLAESLGGYATMRVKKDRRGYRDQYALFIVLPESIAPFRLKRKMAIYAKRKHGIERSIVSVTKTPKIEPVRCITVDSNDGLYLTEGCIPTHNSAHYERPEKIEAALGDNTDVQIDISSVNGSANVFYRRRMAGEIWEPNKAMPKGRVRVFVFDWREHPAKTQEWYDARRKKAEDEGLLHIFAQEVDRDYSASIEGIIIRPEWIAACVDAHIKLADWGDWFAGEHMAANDIADGGGDRNAYASRHGVVLKRVEEWAGEAGDAARLGVPLAIEDNAHEYYYDSIGVGAGFKTESNTMKREGLIPQSMRILPWSAAAPVLDPTDNIIPGDSESPTNENQYENLKAQSWFRLRTRAWKTYLAVTRGQRFEVGEMISIPSTLPSRHKLCMELSQAVKKTAKSGKTLVDKTPAGAMSPNLAESVVMCFNPTREVSGFDVL